MNKTLRQTLMENQLAAQARMGILFEQLEKAKADLANTRSALATLDMVEKDAAEAAKGEADAGS